MSPPPAAPFWTDPLIAACVAAVVALLGFIVNNVVTYLNTGRQLRQDQAKTQQQLAHDRERTAQQLEHDRQKQEADRRLTLRRDIYLGLAEYMNDSIRAIKAWAEPAVPHAEIVAAWWRASKYQGQVHLMGQPPLIEAIVTFNRTIDDAVIEIRTGRDSLLRQEKKLSGLRQQIDSDRKLAAAAEDTIHSKGLQAPLPSAEIERLLKIAEALTDRANATAQQHDAALAAMQEQRWALFSRALSLQKVAYRAAVSVVRAARAELGEVIDMDVYDRILNAEDSSDDGAAIRHLFGLPPLAGRRTEPEGSTPPGSPPQ